MSIDKEVFSKEEIECLKGHAELSELRTALESNDFAKALECCQDHMNGERQELFGKLSARIEWHQAEYKAEQGTEAEQDKFNTAKLRKKQLVGEIDQETRSLLAKLEAEPTVPPILFITSRINKHQNKYIRRCKTHKIRHQNKNLVNI